MQVPTIDAATIIPVQTGGGVTARVVSGNLAQVPIGELLEATVTSVSPREVALTVNGLSLTVRPPVGIPPFQPGTALLVRVPPTAANATNPTIELALPTPANLTQGQKPTQGIAARVAEGATRAASAETAAIATGTTPPARPAAPTAPPLPPPRLAVVDVLEPLPQGRVRAQIDGVEQIATASEPLAPGGRYVLQVERTPAGIKLSPPPENAVQPAEIAAAVLRSPAPTLTDALKPLRAELATLTAPPTSGNARTVPPAVREAAVAVEATLRTIVPNEPTPPDATQLRQLVENGGLHFEAKLARLVAEPEAPQNAPNTAAPAPKPTIAPAPAPATTVPTAKTAVPAPTASAPTASANVTKAAPAANAPATNLTAPSVPAIPADVTKVAVAALLTKFANAPDPNTPADPRAPAVAPNAKAPAVAKPDQPARQAASSADPPTTKPDQPAREATSSTNNTAKPEQPAREPNAPAREPNASVAQAPERAAPGAVESRPGPDLKGDLLRLLQAVNDLGGATAAPATEAAVRGIESQQAANTLAQTNNTPYFLQIPFPDGGEWRTLHLSLEPERRPDQSDAERAGRFRVFMHVPLTDLGETWIDAGLAGDQFRATIYLDRSPVRDRVRSALPELRAELQAEGFSEVLLDVRSSSELPERHRRQTGAMQAGRPETVSVLDVRA